MPLGLVRKRLSVCADEAKALTDRLAASASPAPEWFALAVAAGSLARLWT